MYCIYTCIYTYYILIYTYYTYYTLYTLYIYLYYYTALSARDEVTLEPLLSFLARYINNPRYAKLLIHITHNVLDIYSNIIGYSETIDELFNKLKKQVNNELVFQKLVMSSLGLLDGVINASLA